MRRRGGRGKEGRGREGRGEDEKRGERGGGKKERKAGESHMVICLLATLFIL